MTKVMMMMTVNMTTTTTTTMATIMSTSNYDYGDDYEFAAGRSCFRLVGRNCNHCCAQLSLQMLPGAWIWLNDRQADRQTDTVKIPADRAESRSVRNFIPAPGTPASQV